MAHLFILIIIMMHNQFIVEHLLYLMMTSTFGINKVVIESVIWHYNRCFYNNRSKYSKSTSTSVLYFSKCSYVIKIKTQVESKIRKSADSFIKLTIFICTAKSN